MLFGQYETTYVVTSGDGAAAAGIFAGAMLIWMVIWLAVVAIAIIAMWKIFVKAGEEGWKAIIPIYNFWTLCEIVNKPGWWSLSVLIMLIPFIGWFLGWIAVLAVTVMVALELGKAFGKDAVWSIFLLVLLPIVGYLILGFGGDKFDKTKLSPRTSTGFPDSTDTKK